MPVYTIVGDIGETASEPPVERRLGIIKDLVELLEPVQTLRLLGPETVSGRWVVRKPLMLGI